MIEAVVAPLTASTGQGIAALDPLGVDEAIRDLPTWNASADTTAIAALIRKILPSCEVVRGWDLHATCAAIRDLGMLAASLRRHGVEPIQAVPELEPILVTLGRAADMVPRETVYHYGPWNPTGPRQRRFTGDPNEDGLIECVRSAAPGVEAAITGLIQARASEPGTPQFTEGCLVAARNVRSMVRAINFARNNVDVKFFARALRPYFEPIEVDGKRYLGAAAAHLPLCIVDHLTWGADCQDPTYVLFQEDAVHYAVPAWRSLFQPNTVEPSLVSRVIDAVDVSSGTGTNRPLFESAVALYTVMRVLLIFRGRHKVMADKAYDPKVRMYPVGSGGFSTAVVDRIRELTHGRADALKQAVKQKQHVSLRPRESIAATLTARASQPPGPPSQPPGPR
jgi:hypothetical protein